MGGPRVFGGVLPPPRGAGAGAGGCARVGGCMLYRSLSFSLSWCADVLLYIVLLFRYTTHSDIRPLLLPPPSGWAAPFHSNASGPRRVLTTTGR